MSYKLLHTFQSLIILYFGFYSSVCALGFHFLFPASLQRQCLSNLCNQYLPIFTWSSRVSINMPIYISPPRFHHHNLNNVQHWQIHLCMAIGCLHWCHFPSPKMLSLHCHDVLLQFLAVIVCVIIRFHF